MTTVQRCGYVAIVGRPNVGKSTLLNRLLGKKISITSRKPQTTRHRVLGIKTVEDTQFVFVDTPGLHRHAKRALNRYMNRTVHQVLQDVDVIVFVIDARAWSVKDEWVLTNLQKVTVPIILVLNKIDRVPERGQLLPYLQQLAAKYDFAQIVPLSAKTGAEVEQLQQTIAGYLPESAHFFAPEQVTDRPDYFIITERIREKLTRCLGEELPYALTVTVDVFEEQEKIIRIAAIIWVEKASQKGIVIGQGGEKLKQVGQQAREELELFFGKKIFLQLWVKVKQGWSDDERSLQQLGYSSE